jgi:non-ribosomal peptide synthetase component F
MPVYTKTGSFTNGAAPGISAAFLNNVETALVYSQYGMVIVTPYTVINNATINSGNTNTQTYTGGSTGVPSGAKAVLINTFFTPGSAGMSVLYTPHGTAWSAGNYPAVWVTSDTSHIVGWSGFVVVDANGQLDVKANNGQAVGIYVVINGYLY